MKNSFAVLFLLFLLFSSHWSSGSDAQIQACVITGFNGGTPLILNDLPKNMTRFFPEIELTVWDPEQGVGNALDVHQRSEIIAEWAEKRLQQNPKFRCDIAIGHSFGALVWLYTLAHQRIETTSFKAAPLSKALQTRVLLGMAPAWRGTLYPLVDPKHPAYDDLSREGTEKYYDPKSPEYSRIDLPIFTLETRMTSPQDTTHPILAWGFQYLSSIGHPWNDGLLTHEGMLPPFNGKILSTLLRHDHVFPNQGDLDAVTRIYAKSILYLNQKFSR